MMSPPAAPLEFLGMAAVVRSPLMVRLLETVQKVARTNATVLIGGDTGSGKELIARAVHHYSPRSTRPWVDVNCAALPDHLVESELFGYEKGAFSGADSLKPGLHELADTGTLFLDEVGELDPRMQVKLLRVLDGTPYYRLGGRKKVSADVRFVAATNQDLQVLVAEGRFRKDLYHRLAQVHLRVPPLKERPEDVPALAEFFLARANSPARLAPDTLERLLAHDWPGNVRELRNVVTACAALVRTTLIQVSDLPPGLREAHPSQDQAEATLTGMERRMILDVLERNGCHRRRAAEALGISRRTLSRKLKSYGFREPEVEFASQGSAVS